ncbi:MAG: class I SAM-dependent methyltransferase [Cyanobacteria bacterium P01_F01_bin.150]
MTKVAVNLGPIQETLLIPLLGRAVETKKGNGLIKDEKAVSIVESLDYDFSKWAKAKSLFGATVRTRMFDKDVQAFLAQHPTGTVVEIGCGLNTRFERLDNGQVRWFDLDLPDSLALRRRFFQDEPRRTMIEASILEPTWIEPVFSTGGPWCFVAEAVLIYLDAAQVQQVIAQIANHFLGAWLLTDTTSAKMVDGQANHDAMKHMSSESWFRWRCDDPLEIETWASLKLVQSRTFMDADDEIVACAPLKMQLFVRWLPWLMRKQVQGYRLNRFVIDS